MPVLKTKGAASAQGFGLTLGAAPVYIENVFLTYLYTGTGATQTITNGIDLAGKGGLTWFKSRVGTADHTLFDTSRGVGKQLYTNLKLAQQTETSSLTSFNANGFSLGADNGVISSEVNGNGTPYVSWTFAKQPKFFDVVTYTGTGVARNISHNLGSVPGCIFVKRTDADSAAGWAVWHRSLTSGDMLLLNSSNAATTGGSYFGDPATISSTVFSVTTVADVNANGGTYVAYLFAHDAGGFGLSGTDNVITCGSLTATGSDVTVTLGYEPQWLLFKDATSGPTNWTLVDTLRGWNMSTSDAYLIPNSSAAENTNDYGYPTATGFVLPTTAYTNGDKIVYIAIRRGPMQTPTSGTSVFEPATYAGIGTSTTALDRLVASSTLFAPDTAFVTSLGIYNRNAMFDRLRNPTTSTLLASTALVTSATGAEGVGDGTGDVAGTFNMDYSFGFQGQELYWAYSGRNYVIEMFRRAPGFFDVVCYAGTGVNRTVTHNLGVVPEMMIVKRRDGAGRWFVYTSSVGNTKTLYIDGTDAPFTDSTIWNNTTPTSSVFTVGTAAAVNDGTGTFVAYLFATVSGVSKVGSYTGNGSSQTINCGFSAGSRFVMIKRTDTTGDWYYWDSARGIVAGNDPHLSLNTTAAEVTTDDSVDTDNSGFVVNQVTATNVNVSSATYIFLAIA